MYQDVLKNSVCIQLEKVNHLVFFKGTEQEQEEAEAAEARNADTESQTFKAGDGIRYDWTSPIYTPVNFADWISRTKAFFRDWFYGMDRVFFSYYIG